MTELTAAGDAHPARQPALDGIRGLAIIAVLLYHTGYARGGFLGVDIFFVLSGFLITRLLLRDYERTGRIISVRFWQRRARRLLPALAIFLLIILAYALSPAGAGDGTWLRKEALATIFYVQNYWYVFSLHTAARAAAHFASPLSHTWSLSVEEQFYVFWPLTLALLARWTQGRYSRLLVLVVFLMLTSAALMQRWYSPTDSARAYFSTETRAQALLAGAALAVAIRVWPAPRKRAAIVAFELAGFAGVVFLFWLVVSTTPSTQWMYHGGYLLTALSAACVIAAVEQPTSRALRAALSLRPLAAIGIVSYGLYLYHVPILLWLARDDLGLPRPALVAVVLALTSVLAVLSFFFVERPVLRDGFTLRSLRLGPVVTGIGICALVGIASFAPSVGTAVAEFGYGTQAVNTPSHSIKVLVAGDARAAAMNISNNGYLGGGIHGVTAVADCGILNGAALADSRQTRDTSCANWKASYSVATNAFRPGVSVLMLGANEVADRVVGGQVLRAGTPELQQLLLERLEQVRVVLTTHNAKLILLTLPCAQTSSLQNSPIVRVENDPARIAWFNSVIRTFASRHPSSVQIADYASLWCRSGRRTPAALPAFGPDGMTPTRQGALTTWRWISELARTASIKQGP